MIQPVTAFICRHPSVAAYTKNHATEIQIAMLNSTVQAEVTRNAQLNCRLSSSVITRSGGRSIRFSSSWSDMMGCLSHASIRIFLSANMLRLPVSIKRNGSHRHIQSIGLRSTCRSGLLFRRGTRSCRHADLCQLLHQRLPIP